MDLLNLPIDVKYHTHKFNFDTKMKDIPVVARATMIEYSGKESAIIRMIEYDMNGHGPKELIRVKCRNLELPDGTRVKGIGELEKEDMLRVENEKEIAKAIGKSDDGDIDIYSAYDDDDDEPYWNK